MVGSGSNGSAAIVGAQPIEDDDGLEDALAREKKIDDRLAELRAR